MKSIHYVNLRYLGLLSALPAAILGTGCRDYTCLDTASCPQSPNDGGASSSGSESQSSATTITDLGDTSVQSGPNPLPGSNSEAGVSSSGTEAASPQTSETTSQETDTSGCSQCSAGDASCAQGEQVVCELTDGCWVWSAPRACPGGECAGATNCANCTDVCEPDATACSEGSLQTCELGANGCYDWSAPILCASAECADGASCFVCDDKCQQGAARCNDGELERCESDSQGCWDWGAPTPCDPATCETATSCVLCDDTCSIGEADCSDGSLRTCVSDALGCLDWSTPAPCETGACSSDTQCLVCNNKCSSEGSTSCQGGQLRTCEADSNGCLDWSAASACSTGTCASSSECFVCDNQCSSGSHSCSGSQLSSCTADAQGCYDYTPKSTCGGNTPVCSASNGRCECQSGAAPTCTNSTTVSQCSNGAWADSACTGSTPVCVSGVGCQACTEHSQCPNSACHLSGSKKGTCFATNTVVNVNSAASLLNAVNATTANGESVIKLSAGTYTMAGGFGPKGETAIVGQSGVVIVDNMPNPGDARASFMGSQGVTYYAKIDLRASNPHHTGVGPSMGSMVWLDDMKISGQYNGIYSTAECHIRRTSVYGYSGRGVVATYAGSLFVENSMIGPAASGSSGTTGLAAYSGAVLDVRYSTVVGNHWGVGCSVGDSSGRVANSIIASNINGASIADNYSDCSEAFTLVTNAVDQTGYGTKIPTYSSTWFTSANNGNLHLSAAGKVAIPQIAVRGSGDPIADFDGNARPADGGYPGADQP